MDELKLTSEILTDWGIQPDIQSVLNGATVIDLDDDARHDHPEELPRGAPLGAALRMDHRLHGHVYGRRFAT